MEKEEFTCSICGKKVKEFGNNACPVHHEMCCDRCNGRVVLPARVALMNSNINCAKGFDCRWIDVCDGGITRAGHGPRQAMTIMTEG